MHLHNIPLYLFDQNQRFHAFLRKAGSKLDFLNCHAVFANHLIAISVAFSNRLAPSGDFAANKLLSALPPRSTRILFFVFCCSQVFIFIGSMYDISQVCCREGESILLICIQFKIFPPVHVLPTICHNFFFFQK